MAKTTFFEYLQNAEDAISSGRIDDAMASCQHILSYFPDSLEVQRLLGEIYLAKGQLEDAQQTFDWILVNDPENVVVYCDRALTSERLSDIDTALDCYQQAYELSRGNSQIRQKFNQLSTKVGQQEFMFSRAGLARLYMRGDLLTQAEQEWEAVLNVSPERLDARTGLLETCWREGAYDKVEQLANKILAEVPTCLKALLLLAHVTSTSNMERTRELLQRAEALDPELVMAQDLFSDMIASQPNNPFISMLKKNPIVFSDLTGELEGSNKQAEINSASIVNGTQTSSEAEASAYNSGTLETWKELDTNQPPLQESTPSGSLSTFSFQSEITSVHPSNSITANGHTRKDETVLDPINSSTVFDDEFDSAVLEKQPWYQAENPQNAHSEQASAYPPASNTESPENVHSWSSNTQGEDFLTPPAWLDVLTKFEWQSGGDPATSSISPLQESDLSNEMQSSPPQPEPELATKDLWERDLGARSESYVTEEPAFFSTVEENDSEMAWPEWLKSLGAETLEPQTEQEQAPVADTGHEPEPSTAFQSWTHQIDQTFAEADSSHPATLEYLDNNLLSQGFVPLQPGTLNTIAQEQTLSSALAELGNFSALSDTSEPATAEVLDDSSFDFERLISPSSESNVTPSSQVEIPSGNSQFENTEHAPETITQPLATKSMETSSETPVPEEEKNQMSTPVAIPTEKIIPQKPLVPTYRADAWIEDELETTMKRPAIRLQPMQQSALHSDAMAMIGKARIDTQSKTQNENISNKERLLRGYQFQLAGAYDDAMAEYRIIIRNAPEYLSEVISNVRALLKLSPRYSTGFRVLGDAYMRQGEYLQAMEAYNKALTIAKKAKSQSV